MIALFLSTALAQNLVKTGDICVTASARWNDLAGDNWVLEGAIDRPARGFQYKIIDAVNTYTGNLGDSDGCLHDFTVLVAAANPTFRLEITSKAVVNGVSMVSWQGPHTQSKQLLTVAWPTIGTGAGFTFSSTRNIASQDQRWLNLLVGTMVFRLYDYNVNQGNSRDCCLKGSLTSPDEYNLDGTCGTQAPSAAHYARITTPIQMQAEPEAPLPCCGSTVLDNDNNTPDPPGVHTGLDVHKKFTIAHEFGHVIGGMRTGAKEYGQYTVHGDHNNCLGEFDGGVLSDERGEFRKLTMSTMLREAWGNFVAVTTWNGRYQDDCSFQYRPNGHDFDLDGVVDDDRTDNHFDGAYDCEGIPTLFPEDPTMPAYVTGTNWLEDLEDADDDNLDGLQCARDADDIAESYHRSTVYDGTRFLWDVTTDQGVHPDYMSDIYVDMCPRGWFHDAYPSSESQADLPINRLLLSADHHGFYDEYLDEITHLLH